MGAKGEAVFNLNCRRGPPALRESYGFKLADLNWIEDALTRRSRRYVRSGE